METRNRGAYNPGFYNRIRVIGPRNQIDHRRDNIDYIEEEDFFQQPPQPQNRFSILDPFKRDLKLIIVKNLYATGGALRKDKFPISLNIRNFLTENYNIQIRNWINLDPFLNDLQLDVEIVREVAPGFPIRVENFEARLGNRRIRVWFTFANGQLQRHAEEYPPNFCFRFTRVNGVEEAEEDALMNDIRNRNLLNMGH